MSERRCANAKYSVAFINYEFANNCHGLVVSEFVVLKKEERIKLADREGKEEKRRDSDKGGNRDTL